MERKWPESARWTEDDVSRVGGRNREQMDFAIARAMNYLLDSEKAKRLEQRECARCFYSGAFLAGQAMTKWNCRCCLEDQKIWPNMRTPIICNRCSKNHKLCVSCGADLFLRVKRSNVILLKEKAE